jgi:hypothetical protein
MAAAADDKWGSGIISQAKKCFVVKSSSSAGGW